MNIPEILVANGTGAVLVCFLFLLRVRGESKNSVGTALYCRILVVTLLAQATETISFLLDGVPGAASRFWLYLTNTVCTGATVCVGYAWCLYVDFRVYRSTGRLRRRHLFLGAPLLAVLALLAANIIAGKPEQKESLRAPVENQLLMLRARTEETDEIRKVKKQRTGVWCGAAILCLICGGMAGRFLLDWSNFASRDLEVVVRQMAIETFPWIGLAFILLMAAEQWNFRLLMKELELRRSAQKRKPDAAAPEKTTGRNVIRVIIAAAAVVLIALGVMNGGMFDVLVKAINICTECIGLG